MATTTKAPKKTADLMSCQAAAKLAGVSVYMIMKAATIGQVLPVAEIGSPVRYTRDSVEAYAAGLKQQRTTARP